MLRIDGNDVTASSTFNFDNSLTPTVASMNISTASPAGFEYNSFTNFSMECSISRYAIRKQLSLHVDLKLSHNFSIASQAISITGTGLSGVTTVKMGQHIVAVESNDGTNLVITVPPVPEPEASDTYELLVFTPSKGYALMG